MPRRLVFFGINFYSLEQGESVYSDYVEAIFNTCGILCISEGSGKFFSLFCKQCASRQWLDHHTQLYGLSYVLHLPIDGS